MRFAASDDVSQYLSGALKMGDVAQQAGAVDSELDVFGTKLQGRSVADGLTSAGRIEASAINREAGIAGAQAAGNASMMAGLGKVAGSFIGGIPTGGGSPGIGTGADFGEVGTAGSDLADFGYTPAQDKAFHNGGIDYGWL